MNTNPKTNHHNSIKKPFQKQTEMQRKKVQIKKNLKKNEREAPFCCCSWKSGRKRVEEQEQLPWQWQTWEKLGSGWKSARQSELRERERERQGRYIWSAKDLMVDKRLVFRAISITLPWNASWNFVGFSPIPSWHLPPPQFLFFLFCPSSSTTLWITSFLNFQEYLPLSVFCFFL